MNPKREMKANNSTSELQFQNIMLKDISPDPNQPRKFYEENAMLELTESVLESGVLQPILVRKNPKGKGYMLVCGERRYRAAMTVQKEHKERNTIPAVIRELTDEEALQLQIVENLQRQDVHPMEEAVAFKSLIDGKDWSFEEIGKRVGKSAYYVRQRIKLNSLIEPFQQLFFKHQMEISTALDIARTDIETQKQILEDCGEDAINNPHFHLTINKWQWSKYNANLDAAPFDIADPTLDVGMGPCTQCQFNSSVSKLFPDTNGNTSCGNIACFREKANRSFELHLGLAQEDPTIVLITNEPLLSNETKQLMKDIDGIIERNGFEEIAMPELPERESYDNNNKTKKEDEAEFQKDLKEYKKDLDVWNKKIENGSFLKAFVVGGDDKGKYTYVKLRKAVGNAKIVDSVASPAAPSELDEIDTEIERLKDREKRAKELDGNKMWDQIKVKFLPAQYAEEMNGRLTPLEIQAISQTMYNTLSWQAKEDFRKLFKIGTQAKKLPEIDAQTFSKICRYFFLSLLPPAYCTTGISTSMDASLCLAIAEKYFPDQLREIQDEAGLKTEKRVKRFNERIKELQDKKKKIKSAQKSNK